MPPSPLVSLLCPRSETDRPIAWTVSFLCARRVGCVLCVLFSLLTFYSKSCRALVLRPLALRGPRLRRYPLLRVRHFASTSVWIRRLDNSKTSALRVRGRQSPGLRRVALATNFRADTYVFLERRSASPLPFFWNFFWKFVKFPHKHTQNFPAQPMRGAFFFICGAISKIINTCIGA